MTGACVAGGFVGLSGASFQQGDESTWASAKYDSCTASGSITTPSGNSAPAGSFAGAFDRGTYDNCGASGKVNDEEEGALFGNRELDTEEFYLVRFSYGENLGSLRMLLKKPAEGATVTVSEPAEPTRVGYRFEGWFSDPACEQSYDFETPITENTTIYAKWDKIDGLAWLTPILGALNTASFDDVVIGDWFYDAVRYVNEYGLMTGTSANQFSPDAPVTRGMVMTILARREGIRTDRYSPWYAAGVDWAVANGISDGTNPEAAITREELATMLYRYAQLKGYDLSGAALTGFTDASSVSSYAVPAMQWAVGAGLISGAAGVDAGKLLPQQAATRAQLAAMLHRFFG